MRHEIALLSLLALCVGACTTLGRQSAQEKAPGSVVVHQVARSEPVLSNHDRRYWMDLRQSKDLLPKLQGALATGEAEAGVGLARAYLARKPGDPQGLTMLAAALAMSRKYELSAYYATLVTKAQPDNADAWNIKGLALMLAPGRRVADYHRAMEYFQKAFETDASQVAAGLNLGALALELGSPRRAAEVYKEVVDRCERCVAGLMGLGIAMARTSQNDEAVAVFNEVLAKRPNDAHALYNLALVYKNGYNNGKQAEKYLFALLDGSGTKDVALRERAHTTLRMIKGEASREERTMIADEDRGDVESGHGDERDAEILMTGSEMAD